MNVDEGMRRLRDPNEWDLTLAPRTGAFPARPPRLRSLAFGFAAAAAVAVVATFALVVLAPDPFVRGPVAVDPTATPRPTATSNYQAPENCRSLLDDATIASFESDFWQISDEEQGDMYRIKVKDDLPGSFVQRFLNFGDGIVCAFGPVNSDVGVKYAYGPISAEQASEQRALIEARGYTATRQGGFDVYLPSAAELEQDPMAQAYAFGDGVWAYSVDHGGGGGPVRYLDEILQNAPTN